MYVKLIMKKEIITIRPQAPFYEARWNIQEKGIRHLPVVDEDNRLVGMVTNFNICAVSPSETTAMSLQDLEYLLGKLRVASFMTPAEKLVTVTPDTIIEKAVQLMVERKVDNLPVVDNGMTLLGLVTETDFLATFVDMMGLKEKGTRLTVALEDEPGKLFGVLEVIKKHNVNVASIYSPALTVEGKRLVILRLKTQEYEGIVQELEKIGYEVESALKWPSM
jgi:acetoin utilization protein AcuB